MRRKKEDMLITKDQILNAAFQCFYENGFERTSLETIAGNIGMTRGAIYWHFTDKKTLYRAVIDYVLEQGHGDVAAFARQLTIDLSLQERLDQVFQFALNDNLYVDFVYKAINYVTNNQEFEDVLVKLRSAKQELLRYFDEEIRIYIRMHKIADKQPGQYSSALFLLFEGMFLTKNISIDISLAKEDIHEYIGLIISDLIESYKL